MFVHLLFYVFRASFLLSALDPYSLSRFLFFFFIFIHTINIYAHTLRDLLCKRKHLNEHISYLIFIFWMMMMMMIILMFLLLSHLKWRRLLYSYWMSNTLYVWSHSKISEKFISYFYKQTYGRYQGNLTQKWGNLHLNCTFEWCQEWSLQGPWWQPVDFTKWIDWEMSLW